MKMTKFTDGTVVKNLPANAGDTGDLGLIPGLGTFLGGTSILAWKIPCTESLVGCSPWDHKELDTTEHICSFPFM